MERPEATLVAVIERSAEFFNPAVNRIPALDGVRAIAIILVIVVHAFYFGPDLALAPLGNNLLVFGWTGVDLFFVLSGFLITSILIDMKGKPGAFRNFYVKRFGRIFPLYYAILCGLLLLFFIEHPKVTPQIDNLRENAWLYFTFTSNLSDLLGLHLNNMMGPTWSLAVEEQYYLVWPLLVLGLTLPTVRKLVLGLLVGLAVLRFFLVGSLPNDAIYRFTLTHADGILTGSILALYRDTIFRYRHLAKTAMAGLALLLIGIFVVAGTTHYQHPLVQQFAFLPIALFYGAFLVFAIDSPVISRALSITPLRHIGQYSFFIYLTHLPLLTLLDQLPLPGGLLSWTIFVVLFTAANTGLGYLSWTFFERPVAQAIRRRLLTRHGAIGGVESMTGVANA